jgi:ABC-type proline/glycine betaine transport system ATPase subunit
MLFDQQDVLERKRDAFLEERPGMGAVSLDYPLISNLNVWENIALIRQFHEMWPLDKARDDALESLRLLGMESIGSIRNPDLREEERFAAMLVRACKLPKAEILLDRPFEIVPTVHDFSFFDGMLKKLALFYEACYIFDYRWNKHDYGPEYAEEY